MFINICSDDGVIKGGIEMQLLKEQGLISYFYNEPEYSSRIANFRRAYEVLELGQEPDSIPFHRFLVQNNFITSQKMDEILLGLSIDDNCEEKDFWLCMPSHIKMIEFFACGGMGKIYKVYDSIQERFYAVKRPKPEFIENFHRESGIIANLQHPNILGGRAGRIEGVDRGGRKISEPIIVFEWVDSPNLKELVNYHGPLPESLCVDYLCSLAEAMVHYNKLNTIHRDIKPSNIFIHHGIPKISDFGIAREYAVLQTIGVGSMHYASPEQRNLCSNLDIRSDIYSLGATFYFSLTGVCLLFDQKSPTLNLDHIPISPHSKNLLTKMLQTDRDQRFQSADELLNFCLQVKNTPLKTTVPMRKSLFTQDKIWVIKLLDYTMGAVATGMSAEPYRVYHLVIKKDILHLRCMQSTLSDDNNVGKEWQNHSIVIGREGGIELPPQKTNIGRKHLYLSTKNGKLYLTNHKENLPKKGIVAKLDEELMSTNTAIELTEASHTIELPQGLEIILSKK